MSPKSTTPEVKILMFGESPRWRDGRFWVSGSVVHQVLTAAAPVPGAGSP